MRHHPGRILAAESPAPWHVQPVGRDRALAIEPEAPLRVGSLAHADPWPRADHGWSYRRPAAADAQAGRGITHVGAVPRPVDGEGLAEPRRAAGQVAVTAAGAAGPGDR